MLTLSISLELKVRGVCLVIDILLSVGIHIGDCTYNFIAEYDREHDDEDDRYDSASESSISWFCLIPKELRVLKEVKFFDSLFNILQHGYCFFDIVIIV